jgi:hypothetical protein
MNGGRKKLKPSPNRLMSTAGWGLPLLWALFVFIKYFAHLGNAWAGAVGFFSAARWPAPDFSARFLVWGQSLWILLLSLALIGLTLAWGSRFRRWWGLRLEDSWVRAAFNFGLGVLGLNLFWLGTGFVGLWFSPFLILGLAAAGAVALVDGFRFFKAWAFTRTDFFPEDKGFIFFWVLSLFYLALAFGHGLVPETFYDSMVYHLATPSNWLLRHGITNDPANFFSNYPYGAELYFLNGFFAQGTETAKCLHVAAFLFCALLAGGWSREVAGPSAGWLSAGMVLTLPLLVLNASTTQVEGVLALFTVLFLYALFKIFKEESDGIRWAWVCGLLAGTALSVKYTAAVGLASGVLALGPAIFPKTRMKLWLFVAGGALLLLGPWLVKNFCFTGDPFFPYAADWFNGRHLPGWGYTRLLEEQRAFNGGGFWAWATLPWTLVVSNPDSYNFAGPLALGILPFLFFKRLENPTLRFWAFASGIYFVAGLFITHILRFMVPAFVVFYMLAGAFFARAGKNWGRGLAWGAGVSAFLCFFYFASISGFYYACAGVWWGKETRQDYLQGGGKITPYASMADWISKKLPKDARLLIVGDARGLYYDRPFWSNSVFDSQLLAQAARGEGDPQGIRQILLKWGITHLVVNGQEGVRVSADYHHYDLAPQDWARLDQFFKTQTTLLYDRNFQCVYALQPPPDASGDAEPSPVLFFTAAGKSFIEDYQRQNGAAVDQDLDQALSLYPTSVFWWEQKASAQARLGRNSESEKLFEKAAGFGILTPEGYREWAQTAKARGGNLKAARILAMGRKAYPGSFKTSN